MCLKLYPLRLCLKKAIEPLSGTVDGSEIRHNHLGCIFFEKIWGFQNNTHPQLTWVDQSRISGNPSVQQVITIPSILPGRRCSDRKNFSPLGLRSEKKLNCFGLVVPNASVCLTPTCESVPAIPATAYKLRNRRLVGEAWWSNKQCKNGPNGRGYYKTMYCYLSLLGDKWQW